MTGNTKEGQDLHQRSLVVSNWLKPWLKANWLILAGGTAGVALVAFDYYPFFVFYGFVLMVLLDGSTAVSGNTGSRVAFWSWPPFSVLCLILVATTVMFFEIGLLLLLCLLGILNAMRTCGTEGHSSSDSTRRLVIMAGWVYAAICSLFAGACFTMNMDHIGLVDLGSRLVHLAITSEIFFAFFAVGQFRWTQVSGPAPSERGISKGLWMEVLKLVGQALYILWLFCVLHPISLVLIWIVLGNWYSLRRVFGFAEF